ncbi:MAG: hypothetical protein ABI039_13280 [Vicinamibacterales bacterium]
MLVSVPHGGAAGNILRTGVLSRVLDADRTLRVVLVSPLVSDAGFVREFTHPRITLESLPPHRPEGLEARLLALMQAGYLESGVTESVKIRRAEATAKGIVRWLPFKKFAASVVAPSMLRPDSRYDLSDRFVKHPHAATLFDRYQPSLLVVSNPGLIFSEVPLLRTARQRGVRTIAIDPSWDNFTNKLIPVRRVDRLVVWNTIMKDQAVALHGYQADDIRLAGTPQWDLYFHNDVLTSREEFCRRIGADPSQKVITLTTTPLELYAYYEPLIEQLVAARDAGRWPHPVQLLVRVHPRDAIERYAAFEGLPGVIIEKPFKQTVRSGDGMAVDVTADAQRHLANTMHHSDVVIQVVSTIAIEAAIFDTPVINVSFDGPAAVPFVRSAKRYTQFTHWANIAANGAIRDAATPDQMIELVGRYLGHPELDHEGRRRVVLDQCQFLDGHAAERVAGFVLEEVAAVTGRQLSSSCVA